MLEHPIDAIDDVPARALNFMAAELPELLGSNNTITPDVLVALALVINKRRVFRTSVAEERKASGGPGGVRRCADPPG
jgi:hypothetical protein